MADFNSFFPTLLKHEGGFVNDPADPGAAVRVVATEFMAELCCIRSVVVKDHVLEGSSNDSKEVCVQPLTTNL